MVVMYLSVVNRNSLDSPIIIISFCSPVKRVWIVRVKDLNTVWYDSSRSVQCKSCLNKKLWNGDIYREATYLIKSIHGSHRRVFVLYKELKYNTGCYTQKTS